MGVQVNALPASFGLSHRSGQILLDVGFELSQVLFASLDGAVFL